MSFFTTSSGVLVARWFFFGEWFTISSISSLSPWASIPSTGISMFDSSLIFSAKCVTKTVVSLFVFRFSSIPAIIFALAPGSVMFSSSSTSTSFDLFEVSRSSNSLSTDSNAPELIVLLTAR